MPRNSATHRRPSGSATISLRIRKAFFPRRGFSRWSEIGRAGGLREGGAWHLATNLCWPLLRLSVCMPMKRGRMLIMKRVVRTATCASMVLLVLLSTGCIPIPVPNSPQNHFKKSESKLHVGESDRASVFSALGKPGLIDGQAEFYWKEPPPSGGKTWEYSYYHLTGYELCLIPGPCNPFWSGNYTNDSLIISFDDRGRLKSYSMWRRP